MLPDVDPFVFPLSHTSHVPTAAASSLTSQTIPFSLDVHVQDNNKSSPNIMIWLSLKGNNRMVLMLHSALKMESASQIFSLVLSLIPTMVIIVSPFKTNLDSLLKYTPKLFLFQPQMRRNYVYSTFGTSTSWSNHLSIHARYLQSLVLVLNAVSTQPPLQFYL